MTKIVLVTTVDRDIVVTSRRKVAEDVCKLQGTVTNVQWRSIRVVPNMRHPRALCGLRRRVASHHLRSRLPRQRSQRSTTNYTHHSKVNLRNSSNERLSQRVVEFITWWIAFAVSGVPLRTRRQRLSEFLLPGWSATTSSSEENEAHRSSELWP